MARKKLSDAAKQFIQSGEIDTLVEKITPQTSHEEQGTSSLTTHGAQSASDRQEENSNPKNEEKKADHSGEREKPSVSSKLGKNLKQELFGSVSSKESNIRFTVDLPSSLHRRLNQLSLDAGKPKTELVRIIIRQALDNLDY